MRFAPRLALLLIGASAAAVPAFALQSLGAEGKKIQGKWTGHVLNAGRARQANITEMVITNDKITARDQNRPMGEGSYKLQKAGQLDALALDRLSEASGEATRLRGADGKLLCAD